MFAVLSGNIFLTLAVGKVPNHPWHPQPLTKFLTFGGSLFQLSVNWYLD